MIIITLLTLTESVNRNVKEQSDLALTFWQYLPLDDSGFPSRPSACVGEGTLAMFCICMWTFEGSGWETTGVEYQVSLRWRPRTI